MDSISRCDVECFFFARYMRSLHTISSCIVVVIVAKSEKSAKLLLPPRQGYCTARQTIITSLLKLLRARGRFRLFFFPGLLSSGWFLSLTPACFRQGIFRCFRQDVVKISSRYVSCLFVWEHTMNGMRQRCSFILGAVAETRSGVP